MHSVLGMSHDEFVLEIMRSFVFTLEYLKRNLLLEGQIENWVSILDTHHIGIRKLDRKAIKSLIDCISDNY